MKKAALLLIMASLIVLTFQCKSRVNLEEITVDEQALDTKAEGGDISYGDRNGLGNDPQLK